MAVTHVLKHARGMLSHLLFDWMAVGVVLDLTGFTPDHWIEEIEKFLRAYGLPALPAVVPDPRLILMSIGTAIIVVSGLMMWRASRQPKHAPPTAIEHPSQRQPTYEVRERTFSVFQSDETAREAITRGFFGPDAAGPTAAVEPPRADTAPAGPAKPSGIVGAALPRADYCVGRDPLLAELIPALCGPTPVSCLVRGSGGIGKTTLTLAAANSAEVAGRFGANRWFVKLDTAADASSLQTAVIAALGLDPASSRFGDAVIQLRQQPGLLILDNLETPWEAETEAVEDCLNQIASIPGVALLASIRGGGSPHSPHWNCRIDVGPLADIDASTLFLRIAPRIRPDDPHLAPFLEALGGIPLAIELVAYRAEGDTTLAELWQEWRRLGGALAARPGVDPSRLTSLPHSIDLSLQSRRLGEDGKRLFRLLGQLPAGIARDDRVALFGDAAAQAGEELRSVGLAVTRGDRLDLLPPIRDHAQRFHKPTGTEAKAWRDHYLLLLRDRAPRIGNADDPGFANQLAPDVANFETALRAPPIVDDSAIGAVDGLALLMRFTGLGSAAIFRELTAACHSVENVRGEAGCIQSLGEIALARSDHAAAHEAYEHALPLFRQIGDIFGEATCIARLGEIALQRSDHDAARAAYERALPLFRQIGNILGEANCIACLGDIAVRRSDDTAAREAYERALPLFRQIGQILGEANCIRSLGGIALRRFDDKAARAAYERALPLYRQIGNILGEANCIKNLGDIAIARSDHDAACDAYERALPLYRQVGDILGEANCIRSLGDIALARSDHDGARTRYLEALTLYERIAEPYSIGGAHLGLARVTGGAERAAHVAAARAAWMSIGRADLVEKFLPPGT
jgi:tetratricopeptide (TPR) repeat protein